jgi:DNA helicase IV
MPQINKESEVAYLGVVTKNIKLREDELEELHKNASAGAADGKSQQTLRDFYRNVQVPDPDNPYFVRVDLSNGEIRYYGYQKLRQTKKSPPIPVSHAGVDDLLVLSSRSDGKGYTADYPENLPDLVARTRFIIKFGKILKISEEFFDGSRGENTVIASEIVTESIGQTRNKKMQPISSTLQPDQFQITREPITHSLAIQGPPGSGKTAVLLERLARIAFADEAVYKKGMLLIGPNKAFMDYVSQVLPTLGETDIERKSIDELSQFTKYLNSSVIESEDLIYIKGSENMKSLLENLVEGQSKVISKSAFLKVLDISIEFTAADSFRMLQEIEEESYSNFNQRRKVAENRLRNLLVERFQEGWIAKRGDLRALQGNPTQLITQESAYRTILRNMFPNIDPVSLLTKLKADASFFMECAKGALEAEDQLIWLEESEIQSSKVTRHDVAILDYLDFLINEPIKKWGHIAVDEAQDLSPMELAMVSRRLDASATLSLAGDLAQQTGTQYYESWDGVLQLLEQEFEYSKKELTRSYRVPSDILIYSKQFLNQSRINVAPSEPFLERENSLEYSVVSDAKMRVMDVIARATEHLKNQESVLILAPKSTRAIYSSYSFPDNGSAHVRVMDPTEVKGLEFDAVLIVDPDQILSDYPWGKSRLARLFYVLSTRPTKKLVMIGAESESLRTPLAGIEDEDFEEQIIYREFDELAEAVERTLENAVQIETQEIEKPDPIKLPVDSKAKAVKKLFQDIPTTSILELCRDLKVDLRQASGEFTYGNWMFAGMTQVRCSDCGDKPQMVFVKHSDPKIEESVEGHHFAITCAGCSVIRDYSVERHGTLETISLELKIASLVKNKCIPCEGK